MYKRQIADQFASVSQIYEPIEKGDISMDNWAPGNPPQVDPDKVYNAIKSVKKKKASTVPGDIPLSIVIEFADFLSLPLANIINTSFQQGEYPDIWKVEYVTPVPKVHPPKDPTQLRKISGTKVFSKITEKILSEFMLSDMESKMDPSQYGNQKGISVQHYLINLLNKVLTTLDSKNETMAVILNLIDWSQAFDRQCPKLGVQSFVDNGVRKSLIPVLISYFQNRVMHVKWRGIMSEKRNLPGGGPQGCSMGIIEYLSLSSSSAQCVDSTEKYKWVDDLSVLELVNLVNIGLSTYNFHLHVASDVGTNQYFVNPKHLKSQYYLDGISDWTNQNKMQLNVNKTKQMIFNTTYNYQFMTRVLSLIHI